MIIQRQSCLDDVPPALIMLFNVFGVVLHFLLMSSLMVELVLRPSAKLTALLFDVHTPQWLLKGWGLIGLILTLATAAVVETTARTFYRSLILWRLWQNHVRGSCLADVPGIRIQFVAQQLFSRKTYSEVLEPAIGDFHDEYLGALAVGRLRAQWVTIRGYWSFWSTVAALAPVSLIKKLTDLWKAIP